MILIDTVEIPFAIMSGEEFYRTIFWDFFKFTRDVITMILRYFIPQHIWVGM